MPDSTSAAEIASLNSPKRNESVPVERRTKYLPLCFAVCLQ
jgi:hypothetical protein